MLYESSVLVAWGLRDYGTGEWEGGNDPECEHVAHRGVPAKTGSGLGYPADGGPRRIGDENTYHEAYTKQYADLCPRCGARRVDGQIGLEPTFDEWLAKMVEVFREVRRVLHPSGLVFVNVGDAYARNGGTQGGGNRELLHMEGKQQRMTRIPAGSGLKPKDILLMPERLAIALQADGWWVRSPIPWIKKNAMPESTTDRPTTAIEWVYMLAKTARPFYDGEAVRHNNSPLSMPTGSRTNKGSRTRHAQGGVGTTSILNPGMAREELKERYYTHGRARRNSDWYFDSLDDLIEQTAEELRYLRECRAKGGPLVQDGEIIALDINPQGYPGAHFATFSPKLVEPMVRAGTSAMGVCAKCGSPWRRVVEKGEIEFTQRTHNREKEKKSQPCRDRAAGFAVSGAGVPGRKQTTTLSWQPTCTCNCPDTVPAIVLDCFVGSGVTAAVALQLGRNAVGIDLNPKYLDLAIARITKAAGLRLTGAKKKQTETEEEFKLEVQSD